VLYVTAEREEKLADEERDRLLSATHNDDNPSKLTSTDVSSSIKDVHISDGHQSKASSLFRRSSSASKSHRRVVSRNSDSDEDCIGPPVPSTNSGQLQQPTRTDDESDDDEIGPAAPTAETLQNINQATDEQPESSDEEIGPPLPDAAASNSEQNDGGSKEARANDDDDDDDEDSDDGGDEVAVLVFIHYSISKCLPLWICTNCNQW